MHGKKLNRSNSNMILKVKEIIEVLPFKMKVLFNTGEVREVDFGKIFRGEIKNPKSVLNKLKDEKIFMQAKLNPEWEIVYWDDLTTCIHLDGSRTPAPLDLSPDFMYEHSVPVSKRKLVH